MGLWRRGCVLRLQKLVAAWGHVLQRWESWLSGSWLQRASPQCAPPEQAPPPACLGASHWVCGWGVLVALFSLSSNCWQPSSSLPATPSSLCLVVSVRIWAIVDKLHVSVYLWGEFVAGSGRLATGVGPQEGEEGTARASRALLTLAAPPDSLSTECINAQREWRPAGCSVFLHRLLCPWDRHSKQHHGAGRSATN